MSTLRVIQWTTGKVGKYSLRARFVPPSEWHPSDFSILTALPSVNAIPAVCAAKPGLLTLRDVGLPYSPVGLWT